METLEEEESESSQSDKEVVERMVKQSMNKSSRKSIKELQRKTLNIQAKSNNFKASDKSSE